MATKLQAYNGALRFLGQGRLTALTNTVEGRYLLDGVWDEGGVDACLEMGLWNFAMRTVEINYDSSVDPSFGFRYAFSKPTDWIRTAGMGADEYLVSRLRDEACKDEGQYWYADITPIYVRFVSNDNSYGNNLSKWPQSFANLVQGYLGIKIMPVVIKSQSEREAKILEFEKLKRLARGIDAMNEGSPSLPEGNWSRSRRGRFSSGWDIGSRTRLIG